MKKDKEQIDLLLRQNESEQLVGFNWDRLQTSISKSLNQAERSKTSKIKYRRVFKIAAGITAAAAVVFIAVMIKTNMLTEVKFENGDKGIIAFFENKDSTNIKILDSEEQDNKREDRSSWIIIHASESKVADNGQSRDENDFACLM